MAFSQEDLNAIAAAQAAHPTLPPRYLYGVAKRETGASANPDTATSGTGPVGLFQIAPSTYQSPGYGLPSHPVSREQAIAALQDPNVSAQFGADYLVALQGHYGGNLDAATRTFSGGGYGQADVVAAAASQPITGQDTPLSGSNTATAPGGANSAASGGSTPASSAASSLLTPVWELVTRGLVFTLGMFILLIAIFALVWHSKTVQVQIGHLTR